jgi:hypothetical protein
LTDVFIAWMKYHLLPTSRKMHEHCMVHYLAHVKVG